MKSYWLMFGVVYATGVAAVFWFGTSRNTAFEANHPVVDGTTDSVIAKDDAEGNQCGNSASLGQ